MEETQTFMGEFLKYTSYKICLKYFFEKSLLNKVDNYSVSLNHRTIYQSIFLS